MSETDFSHLTAASGATVASVNTLVHAQSMPAKMADLSKEKPTPRSNKPHGIIPPGTATTLVPRMVANIAPVVHARRILFRGLSIRPRTVSSQCTGIGDNPNSFVSVTVDCRNMRWRVQSDLTRLDLTPEG